MSSGWATFRQRWLKPEVYPLIGAMAAAIGVCSAALINKARDPSVTWNKAKRTGGDLIDADEENLPMWHYAKNNSARIFSRENVITDYHKINTELPPPITVKIGEAEEPAEEEDEQPADESPAEVQAPEGETAESGVSSDAEVAAEVAAPVLDVVDEAAETINAAVDAAIESAAAAAAAVAEAPKPAPSSVEEVSSSNDKSMS